ncbi:MAG: SCO family protein [Hydrogenophilaceae bacterium]|nr:SCO family protein [Hydrogenophilaceae bacterium]
MYVFAGVALLALALWLVRRLRSKARHEVDDCAAHTPAAGETPPKDPDLIYVAPFPPGGDFTLDSASGAVSLQDFRGKVVLLFFGYTYCPDVCPMSLVTLSQTLKLLTEADRSRVKGIFISVDPQRDNVQRLEQYTSYFGSDVVGVTGSPEQIAAVADLYGAQYYRVDLPGSAMGYAIDHSAAIYLIDPKGKLRLLFRHTANPERIAESIRKLLK